MRPESCVTGRWSTCLTRASASIRANTRSLADSPSWNWLQNEAMLVSGNQNRAIALYEQEPLAGRHRAPHDVDAAGVDHHRATDAGDGAEDRKDGAEHHPLAQI